MQESDIGTNPPASAGAAGVQGITPPAYEAGAEGIPDDDQGQAGQSDGDLPVGEDGESGALDTAEVEYEGQKYTVPKALEAAILKNADYTQKTQALAERERAATQEFSERQLRLQQQAEAAQHLSQQRAALTAMDMQLQQYQGIDWQQASAQDPQAAQQAFMRFQQLRDQRAGVAQQLQHQESTYARQVEAEAAKRVSDVVAGWTEEERQAVNTVARDMYGVTAAHLGLFGRHPELLGVLRDALAHQKALKAAAAATTRKGATSTPQAKPEATLPQGGRAAPPKSMADPTLSMDEWIKRRNEQVRKRR